MPASPSRLALWPAFVSPRALLVAFPCLPLPGAPHDARLISLPLPECKARPTLPPASRFPAMHRIPLPGAPHEAGGPTSSPLVRPTMPALASPCTSAWRAPGCLSTLAQSFQPTMTDFVALPGAPHDACQTCPSHSPTEHIDGHHTARIGSAIRKAA